MTFNDRAEAYIARIEGVLDHYLPAESVAPTILHQAMRYSALSGGKRIRPLICDGKPVHVIGIPIHWGFKGAARKGFGSNSLGPFVGDANIETPEYKAFLVNIEPSEEPVA